MIDPTIRLGDLIQASGLLSGGLFVIAGLMWSVRGMKTEMEGMKNELIGLRNVVTTQAVQNTRLERLEQDVHELRHGEGLVMPFKYRPPEKA